APAASWWPWKSSRRGFLETAEKFSEHAERPDAAPVRGAASPRAPCRIGHRRGDPSGSDEIIHPFADERLQVAAQPVGKRQREALLRTVHRGRRQRLRKRRVKNAFVLHQRRVG